MLIWYSAAMLALEAGSVIQSRLTRMAVGDLSEGQLMMTEKMNTALEACFILSAGGNAESVIECYRKAVASNAARLNGSDPAEREED